MKVMLVLALRLFVVLPFLFLQLLAEEPARPLVRIAELEIDPTQVESYKAALKEEIEASIRLESGVLALYAVAVKDHPERIRIFEVYGDDAAYRAHLETPHFKKYKESTKEMVKSLQLVETDPILLGSQSK
ncbi:MAG TPA: antibiotic biosynthesis monooxygenase [Verrucomicrobium sp.]|nr:antibiotic biosynthesis monooxygenase [Verrucomicrobium sp.]